MILIQNNPNGGFSYKEETLKKMGVTKDELARLGKAVKDWFYAEMSDDYNVTKQEEFNIKEDIKDLLEKYSLVLSNNGCIETKA